MKKSITSTMLGSEPSEQDVEALIAYLQSRQPLPNPFRLPDGSLSKAAARGKQVFDSEQANCSSCHTGPWFTDGQIHDVDTEGSRDRLKGYNTPTLVGTYRKTAWLHDGRASSLDDLLTGPHRPSVVSGEKNLSNEQVRDLVEYLKSL
jgi:cytochrome c peroxidase